MIDATLHRAASRNASGPGLASDYRVDVKLFGESFSSSKASLQLDGRELLHGPQSAFHAFCANAIGASASDWPPIAERVRLGLTLSPSLSTIEQNLIKAAML